MRSRYSAYSLSLSKYIIETTHKENIDFKSDTLLWRKEILEFSNNYKFEKLTILDFQDNGNFSSVTFTAQLNFNGNDESFTEKSKFEKVNNVWLYLSGVHL